MKLWGARFEQGPLQAVEEFSSSIHIDQKLWQVDIISSKAHARMLGKQNIIPAADAEKIIQGLDSIYSEIQSGAWSFDSKAEDIHGEIEKRLFEKIGPVAKKVHTARSRNDQIATDTRMYLSEKVRHLIEDLKLLQKEFLKQAELHTETILPGMTHLQHAQPVSLAHHLMAYFWMHQRDVERLQSGLSRVLSMPLGSAALAGTGFSIDREQTRAELNFEQVSENSLDAVSDRDFVIEYLSNFSIIMMHMSRFCEELILWSTPEFAFVELGDEVTTGSSIMPQKKNPDVAELIRGRVGRVYGTLMGALTMMKALPLSYNRDMQEDKEHLFMGLEVTASCVYLMRLMLERCNWKKEKMSASLKKDFSNATDLADDLVEKGMSFREAHEVIGALVRYCASHNKGLEDLTLSELKSNHSMFDEKSMEKIPHLAVMHARKSAGGTAPAQVKKQIELAKSKLQRL